MSSVARTVAAIVLLLAVGLAQASKFPGSCPTANPNPTGCYCTNGCSVGYDTNKFRWTYPTWPPRLVSANTLGGDTICAKITFPTQSLPSDVKALAAYLGITGDIFNNGTEMDLVRTGNEVTIYTAFTQSECETFQSKASGALSGWLDALSARSLYVKFCTSEGCNTIDSEAVPDLPLVPITASGRAAAAAERFPGDCPLSNPSEIGCYCTSSCSVNNDFVNLLWTPPVWAPAQVPARIMGPDTICARVTIPIKTDTSVGREMAQFLGLYGNVSLLNPNYDDVVDGTEVTIYTAFTYFECQRFQDIADRFVSRYSDARKPLVYMCTDPFCNSPGAVTTALNADTSSAFGPSMVILLLAALLMSLF